MQPFLPLVIWVTVAAGKQLNVALIAADKNPDLTPYIGWRETAGAVGVAWDKIVEDGILPEYDAMNLTWRLNDCVDAETAGEMIEFQDADVVLGPPCSRTAIIGGTVASYYNTPIVLWGPPYSSELLINNDYPTLMASSSCAIYQAISTFRILDRYQWTDIAVLNYISGSDLLPRCNPLLNELDNRISTNNNSNATIVFRRQLSNPSVESFRNALKSLKLFSRVVVVCLESDEARRNFLLAAHDEGLTNNEWVYLMVESRRNGFLGASKAPIWSISSNQTDARDQDALQAARRVLLLDNQLLNDTEKLETDVIEKMKQPPYNCYNCTSVNAQVSQVGELGDAMYTFALALNKTIAAGQDIKNGRTIADNAYFEFKGFTGTVIINKNSTRDPVFNLWVLDTTDRPIAVLRIAETLDTNKDTMVPSSISALTSEETMWSNRGGERPLNRPECDFDGTKCPLTFAEQYLAITISCSVALLVLVILVLLAVVYIIRSKRNEAERMDRLWKIPVSSLELPKSKNDGSKSSRSLQSTLTTSTKHTVDSRRETETYAFYTVSGEPVAARKHTIQPSQVNFAKHERSLLRSMRTCDHDNLCRFIGICYDGPMVMSVWRFCPRGSLKDIIAKGTMNMDWFFKFSLIRDITEGIHFLHHSPFGAHGWLSSASCLVNERWQVKLTYYGLNNFKTVESQPVEKLLWTAPEHLRDPSYPPSTPGDIYSFAIICSEILTKKSAWDLENSDMDAEELIYKLKKGKQDTRPSLDSDEENNSSMLLLVRDCWSEIPAKRPTIDQIKSLIKGINHSRSSNLMDHVFNVLEQYAENLEEEVQSRMKELEEEKKKSDILLYRMLPKQVADQLKLGQSVQPETFECVTIFFSDVVSFTTLASRCTPLQVVNLLNDLYTLFDGIIDDHDVYKVETIGDGYLCVSGLPQRNGNEHAREIAQMSMELLREIKGFRIPHLPTERINIRVGLHTGSVVTGVVGITMPRYCLFGDAVNTASRMESNGKPARIHISTECKKFLTEVIGGYRTELRGEVIVKGKGAVETYWLLTEDDPDNST